MVLTYYLGIHNWDSQMVLLRGLDMLGRPMRSFLSRPFYWPNGYVKKTSRVSLISSIDIMGRILGMLVL